MVSNRDPSESAWLPLVRETWTLVEQRVREEEIGARFLLSPNESGMKHVPDRVVNGASRIRALDGEDSVRFTVIDEETVVFWIETAPVRGLLGRESVAVHTDAEGPVSTHIALFERLWEDASSPR